MFSGIRELLRLSAREKQGYIVFGPSADEANFHTFNKNVKMLVFSTEQLASEVVVMVMAERERERGGGRE
jgi:hypothetical protein